MRVLIGCEFSAKVRDAFRKRGIDAWSCDILPCEGDSRWHIQDSVLNVLHYDWDLAVFHPPCTYLTVSGNKWFKPEYAERFPQRRQQREEAIGFVLALHNAPIPKVAIENPIGVLSSRWRKPDQVIQPYQFGHAERKATCLWLRGLPKLQHTNIVALPTNKAEAQRLHYLPPSKDRWKLRSTTFQGIADAMADQWGSL